MKKLLLITLALFMGVAMQAAPSLTTDLSYTSKYVFRGVEVSTGAFQPSANVEVGNFTFGVWNSTPVEKNYELEFDYSATYNVAITKNWSVDLGATVYHYPGQDTSRRFTTEGLVALNGTILGFESTSTLYYDKHLQAVTGQHTLSRSFDLTGKLSLTPSANVGHVRYNQDRSADYTYYGAGANLAYKFSPKSTITVGGNWADDNLGGGSKGDLIWGTAAFNVKF